MDKLIITAAVDALASQLLAYPDLPRTPKQIADEAVRVWEAGGSIVHLHVLDQLGRPTQELTAFRQTLAMICDQTDLIIESSTGRYSGDNADERAIVLQAGIEMASWNAGSVNVDEGVFVNTPQDIDFWAHKMKELGVKPNIVIFEAGMIETAGRYLQDGLIDSPPFFNFALGQTGALSATPRNLFFLVQALPPGALWEITGYKGRDLEVGLWALALGGHARTGFEDNIYYRPGERASSNAVLVERLVHIAREVGRDIASPAEARQMLGLPSI